MAPPDRRGRRDRKRLSVATPDGYPSLRQPGLRYWLGTLRDLAGRVLMDYAATSDSAEASARWATRWSFLWGPVMVGGSRVAQPLRAPWLLSKASIPRRWR